MFKKKFFTNLLFLIIFGGLKGQNLNNNPSVIPPTPNMSGLGKYIEQPVSTYTGIPEIQIPIFTVKTNDIVIPISLRYHASGIKVEEIASWVGLGWSLNAGGVVSRSVRGLPDDLYNIYANVTAAPSNYNPNPCVEYSNVGFLYCGADIETMYNTTNDNDATFTNNLRLIGMNAKDGIPDIFYFSFGNYSGEFIFDKNGNVKLTSQQDLKFEIIRPTGREIYGFIITTPEGLQYDFEDVERQRVQTYGYNSTIRASDGVEIGDIPQILASDGPFFGVCGIPRGPNINSCESERPITYNASWSLTQIKSLVTNEIVVFNYADEATHTRSYSNQTLQIAPSNIQNIKAFTSLSATSIFTASAKLISNIEWRGGSISFERDGTQREDVEPKYGPWNSSSYNCLNRKLNAIHIFDNNSHEIKTFNFTHSYFTSPSPNFSGGPTGTDYTLLNNAFSKRLRLDKIKEDDLPPYEFSYNSIALPNRVSNEQDFWGYYTPNNATRLIPKMYEYPDDPINENSFYTSQFSIYHRNSYVGSEIIHDELAWDRNCNDATLQAASLTEIVYPTGGGTRFYYEPNEFYIGSQKLKGAGMRIKKIIISDDKTYNEAKDIVKVYDYNESGYVVDLPIFASYRPASSPIRYHGSWSSGFAITKGGFVGYKKVSEIMPNNGKTVFSYLMPATYGTSSEEIFLRPVIKKIYLTQYRRISDFLCVTYPPNSKFDFYPRPYSPNYEWKRGLLEKTETYDKFDNMIEKKTFTYTLKNYETIKNLQVDVVHVDEYSIPEVGQNECWFGNHSYNYSKTFNISAWLVPDATTQYKYSTTGSLITTTKYFFESSNHHQITMQTSPNSSGNNIITKMKYAFDYVVPNNIFDPETNGIKLMQEKNIKNVPLEISNFIEKGGNEYLTSASLNTFKSFGANNLLLPSRNFQIESLNTLIDFQPSSINSSALTKDSRYKEQVVFNSYDANANLLSMTKKNDVENSFIWSYNNIFPIAHVENAAPADIAYTSFESDERGNWTFNGSPYYDASSPTGIMSYILDGTNNIVKSGLTPSNIYTVSYWTKNANPYAISGTLAGFPISGRTVNGWKYFEHKITGQTSITISGVGSVDELRLYPDKALMTTYTFQPSVGMTSKTDPNSKIIYYEYDAFGKLINIKDQEKNIIKSFEYHFKN